jgi:hypothetical protein
VKRIGIGAGAIVIVLALAAVAMGASRSYTGKVDPGGTVSFTAKVHHHKAAWVTNFAFEQVPAACENQPGPYFADISGNPLPPMHVNARHRFHGAFQISGTDQTARVRGVFRRHGKRARGRLRLTGTFGGAANCDTGRDRWRAHRT